MKTIMYQNHKTCKYWNTSCKDEPCKSCLDAVLKINDWRSKWEPKEDNEIMDNTYSNGEMVDLLLDNPKRKAVLCSDYYPLAVTLIMNEFNGIVWENSRSPMKFKLIDKKNRWTIIEPPRKLKEMTTQEMAKYYSRKVFDYKNQFIKSVVTGRDMNETTGFTYITEEEIDGLWTVSGVYEDD